MQNAITAEWLDELLAGVNVQHNPYSINRIELPPEARKKIIAVLLPALHQRLAKKA